MGMRSLEYANEESRRLVRGSWPLHLGTGGLAAALEYLVKEVRQVGGPDINFFHDIRAERIPPPVEVAAFRIVQELLINACRHSESSRFLLGLTEDDNMLCVMFCSGVEDWGIGLDPSDVSVVCYGLEGIRRRVSRLHGIMNIQREPGQGTLIAAELPLQWPG